jgi:DNA polymerase-3 subunit beta
VHFTIDRGQLLSELKYLEGVVPAKHIIPALSHVRIEAMFGILKMRATDLDLTMTSETQADIRKAGAICLPLRKLTDIVKSLPKGEVDIKTDDDSQATIICNSSRFKLKGLNADEFPQRESYSGQFAEIPSEVLSRFIPRIIHAASQESSRYALDGAKLEITSALIRMVATDGHRLALIEQEGSFDTEVDVIVPRKALVELEKICSDGEGPLRIGKSDNHIHFELGKRRITTSLLTGQYPDYSLVLPKQNHNRLRVGRNDISLAIKRVALMADDRSHTIKMDIGAEVINITSQSHKTGEAGETVPIDYQGEPIIAGFNATYLNDFFNAIDEDEVLLEFETGEKPVQLSGGNPAYNDRCFAVIMPMRLGW